MSERSAREGDGWDALGYCVTGMSENCFRWAVASEGGQGKREG